MVCEKKSRGDTSRSCRKPSGRSFVRGCGEFRRDPSSLTAQEKVKLEALFEKPPDMQQLAVVRVACGVQDDLRRDARSMEGGAGVDRVDCEVIGSVPGDGQDIRDDV